MIPLNADAMAAIHELFKGAEIINGSGLNHYVVPACENGKIDPIRPQTSWRTAWRNLTRTIQCPTCGQLQHPGQSCCNKDCKADNRYTRFTGKNHGFTGSSCRYAYCDEGVMPRRVNPVVVPSVERTVPRIGWALIAHL